MDDSNSFVKVMDVLIQDIQSFKSQPKKLKKMTEKTPPYKLIDNNPLHRQYEGYFLLDWETGKLRVVKTTRPIQNSYVREIPIKYKFRVEMPEIPMQEMDVSIKLSESKITDIMVDAL